MNDNDVDLGALSAQLMENKVAFGTDNPVNEALGHDVTRAIATAEDAGTGSLGVVVLESTWRHPAQLRDIAEDLRLSTDLDTIVVRTPNATAAASDTLTRAQVERGEYALISQPDYAVGVEAFGRQAEATVISWIAISATLVAGIIAVAVWTYMRTLTDVTRNSRA